MEHSQVLEYIEKYQRSVKLGEEDIFQLAICNVQLGNYAEAHQQFGIPCKAMLESSRKFWSLLGRPDRLVDTFILSKQKSLSQKVIGELDIYKTLPSQGTSLYANVAYVMMGLFSTEQGLDSYITALLKRPKYKDNYAIGQVCQAMIHNDEAKFNLALSSLLEAYKGKVKYGELRNLPEGLLCMSAMSLAYMALGRNLKVSCESEYFSMDYLLFLQEAGADR